jgi:predicted Fe-Mo cluster-binding NifX family protein
MKVSIPTMGDKGLDESVGEHFGRVPTYTIVDLDTNEVTVIPNTSHHMGGHRQPPEILQSKGINVMICRGLGRRAIAMFQDFGINVHIGATGTVREAIDAFKSGQLQRAGIGNACEQHAFRDHHHHG